MNRLRDWLRRDPKGAGMFFLILGALLLWLIVQRVFAKPLGKSCRNDMDCESYRCLDSVVFGYAGGGGTCTRSCSADADCPSNFECKTIELVLAAPHEKVSPDAPKETARFCFKR